MRFICFLLFCTIFTNVLVGQDVDTLSQALILRDNGHFQKSSKLLHEYFATNNKNLNAGWLYAQSLHKLKEYKRSQSTYSKLMTIYPDNVDLHFDYGIKLVEAEEFKKAIFQFNILKPYVEKDYLFVILKKLAQIYLWRGEYDKSKREINFALKLYPNDPEAINLNKSIDLARKSWLIFDLAYFEDDQPLNKYLGGIKTIFYKNEQLSLGLEFNSPIFIISKKPYSSQWINGIVKYHFKPSNLSLRIDAGLIRYPLNKYDWTGAIHINKLLFKYLTLNLSGERIPYLATNNSITNEIMQSIYRFSIDWDNPSGWLGKASYAINQFPEYNNHYQTASIWLVTPSLIKSKLGLKIGYGFNYSDSKRNNFISTRSIDDLILNWNDSLTIDGVYNPFFTPSNQTIHSLIGIFSYMPNKKITLGLNVNYGFRATSDTPYLFLDNKLNNEPFIDRDLLVESYHPLQIDSYILYNYTSGNHLKAYYTYQKTNYYISYIAGISSVILF